MRWVCGVLAVVVASGCKHHFECVAHGGAVVRQVETEHFVVTADLDEDLLTRQAAQLEQLWGAWAIFFRHVPQTPTKLQVLLSSSGATSEFSEGNMGFVRFTARPVLISDLVLISTGTGTRYYSANAHEMAHFVSHFRLRRQPRWLGEGLASYLDDAQFVRTNTVRMGNWQWSGVAPDTLETMWSWDQMQETGATQAHRYDSAWAWVHFFVNQEERRFTRLLWLMQDSESPRAAFEEVFPHDEWPALQKRLQAYLSAGRYRGWETTGLPVPNVSKPRVLAPWEVHLIRREYADGAQARRKESLAAQALAGATPPGAVTLAAFEDTRGPQQSEVLDALPGDAHAELLASRAPDLSPLERFHLAESAAKVLTDDVDAQARFAELAAERGDPRALQASQRVLKMAPWWDDGYFIRVAALRSQGRCADARKTLEDARSLSREGDTNLPKRIERELTALAEHCREAR